MESNRTLLMLPFGIGEVLVPGQTTTLVLKEGRYFDLLDEAYEDHNGVIGTVLMGNDELLQTVPLCEISAYALDAGYRGKVTATVTLKCVSRVKFFGLKSLKPYMQGKCEEIIDDVDVDLVYAREIVNDIEDIISTSPNEPSYQKAFWLALNALDYKPTSLLTTDPSTSNEKLELEAASWAALSVLSDPGKCYAGLGSNNLIKRLRLVLQTLLEERFRRVNENDTPTTAFDSGFE